MKVSAIRPISKWAGLLLISGAAVAALQWALAPGTPPLPPSPVVRAATPPTGFAQSYAEALAQADIAVASADARAQARSDEWLLLEVLAKTYAARARLTGSYDDYAAAQAVL